MSGCSSIRVKEQIKYRRKHRLLVCIAILSFSAASAQHYTAINGSGYFGSLNVYNNPASIVNNPYKWDLTLFGTQFTTITNTIRGHNFPFYLPQSAKFTVANGNYVRKADLNYNIRLLNARISLNKNQAIAFGLNFKGYLTGSTSRMNYVDSIKGPTSFLFSNFQNKVLGVNLSGSAWMEMYGSYGATIIDNAVGKLTGGITLKVMRGMSGGFAKADYIGVLEATEDERLIYKIANGDARYGYSANYGNADAVKIADLFSGSRTNIAFDLGLEYVIKTQEVSSVYDEDDQNNYEWKFGFSLLDLGANKYNYSPQSRHLAQLKENTTSTVLQEKFLKIKNIQQFNDSVSSIVNISNQLNGEFSVANPARVVINADRHISGNVYVNAELSVNLLSNPANDKMIVQETNFITVTPRWENRKFGFYAPVQVTQRGNFWIGGAVKAGPLLLGTHDLLNIFSSDSFLSGGAYLALILRPSDFIRDKSDKHFECPAY